MYYVFYNGSDVFPEAIDIKLSDALAEDIRIFISDKKQDGKSDEEIKARVKKYYGLEDSEIEKFFLK